MGRILIGMAPPAGEPSCKAALRPRGIRLILGAFLPAGFSARTSLRTPPWSATFPRSPGFVVERVDRAPLRRVLRIRAPCRGTRRPCFSPQDSPQKPRRGVAPRTRQSESTASAESRRGILSTLELRTCFELPATHGWAAQLYLHPTTDRLGSPAAPPSTATGDPLITAAAIMSLLAGGVAPACICSVVALSVTARQRSGRPHPSQSEPNFPLLLVVSRLSRKRTLLCEPFEHAGDVHGEKPVS